jgi:hypothetical protein
MINYSFLKITPFEGLNVKNNEKLDELSVFIRLQPDCNPSMSLRAMQIMLASLITSVPSRADSLEQSNITNRATINDNNT